MNAPSGNMANRSSSRADLAPRPHAEGEVSLRRMPYPYQAALAICSDIDETQNTEEFLEIQQFLNTKKTTALGEGLGLEIGNSFYFYDDQRHFSFFTHEEKARQVIIDLIHAGYMDCLHSYGDAALSRDHIARSLEMLHQADCHLDVWVNHYGAQSNIGNKFEYFFGSCLGDDPAADLYHADETLAYGIRFAWVGATTRVSGQAPHHPSAALASVYDSRYPVRSSLRTLLELRKNMLGRFGDERYHLQWRGELFQPLQLRDGQWVYEFVRYCNHPFGIDYGASAWGLAYAIAPRALAYLKRRQGDMIVYTHLGKNLGCPVAIPPETQAALRNVEREYRSGKIYVTTTSRLLNYRRNHRCLDWSYVENEDEVSITIRAIRDTLLGQWVPTLPQLQGITFYIPPRRQIRIDIAGKPVRTLSRNPADETGRESVMIPLQPLSFPYE